MKKLLALVFIALLVFPVMLYAHPGHGSTGGYTIIHYLVEPGHIVSKAIALVFIVCIILSARSQWKRKL
jgi:hypothetical protein